MNKIPIGLSGTINRFGRAFTTQKILIADGTGINREGWEISTPTGTYTVDHVPMESDYRTIANCEDQLKSSGKLVNY